MSYGTYTQCIKSRDDDDDWQIERVLNGNAYENNETNYFMRVIDDHNMACTQFFRSLTSPLAACLRNVGVRAMKFLFHFGLLDQNSLIH